MVLSCDLWSADQQLTEQTECVRPFVFLTQTWNSIKCHQDDIKTRVKHSEGAKYQIMRCFINDTKALWHLLYELFLNQSFMCRKGAKIIKNEELQ